MKKQIKQEVDQPKVKTKTGQKSSVKVGEIQRRIRVQFDINYSPSKGKIIGGDSETIPDMNLTVRQLLENHTRGKTGEVEVRQPVYFEREIPTINDLTDVDDYNTWLKEEQVRVQDFVNAEIEEKRLKEEKIEDDQALTKEDSGNLRNPDAE